MAANTANGIVAKQSKGGFVVAKFTSGGFIKPNHATSTVGANTANETVQSMNIVSMQVNCGGANSCYFEIRRGANTICALTGQDYLDLSDGRILDTEGGNPQANLVVTKIGSGPSTLIVKLHKISAVSGGSTY